MEKKLNIEGMSCMHCVGRVKKHLESFASNVKVDLEAKEACFTANEDLDMASVIKTINSFGFTAKEKQ